MSSETIFNFRPGDLVVKARGSHKGKIGIIISVITNSLGNTILTVLTDRLVRNWYADYVEML